MYRLLPIQRSVLTAQWFNGAIVHGQFVSIHMPCRNHHYRPYLELQSTVCCLRDLLVDWRWKVEKQLLVTTLVCQRVSCGAPSAVLHAVMRVYGQRVIYTCVSEYKMSENSNTLKESAKVVDLAPIHKYGTLFDDGKVPRDNCKNDSHVGTCVPDGPTGVNGVGKS